MHLRALACTATTPVACINRNTLDAVTPQPAITSILPSACSTSARSASMPCSKPRHSWFPHDTVWLQAPAAGTGGRSHWMQQAHSCRHRLQSLATANTFQNIPCHQ
jgi:hypothetical protein